MRSGSAVGAVELVEAAVEVAWWERRGRGGRDGEKGETFQGLAHASDNVFKRSEPELLLGFPRAGRVALGLVEVVETFHVIVTHGRGGGSVVVERGRGLKTRMQVDGGLGE